MVIDCRRRQHVEVVYRQKAMTTIPDVIKDGSLGMERSTSSNITYERSQDATGVCDKLSCSISHSMV